jgi:uncharacterized protein YndB with AHSA1/START domain
MEQAKVVTKPATKMTAHVVKKRNRTKIIAEPGKQELIIIREFDAPRELVFQTHTDQKLYKQFLGPRRMTTRFETFEPKAGGSYRFVQTDMDGKEYAFHGICHEVLVPERIIGTFEFEGLPEAGHVLLETTRFEALPKNRTRIVAQDVYQSVADRDGMFQAGMEEGIDEGYDRLDELLAKLQARKK